MYPEMAGIPAYSEVVPIDGSFCLNARGQIVGLSSDCFNALHAFVWEEGGPMLDLNTLITPGSGPGN